MSEQLDITSSYLTHGNYRLLHAGDSYDIHITAQQSSAAIDIAGGMVWFGVKKRPQDLDSAALLLYSSDDSSEIEITDGPNGQFTIHLLPTDTASLEGTWYYEVKIKLASGAIMRILRGQIQFEANLVRAS